jgi:hypothetical protein
MKQSLVILGILILVAGGYYFLHDSNNEEALCVQVITDARNPQTGEIKEFKTPCDVPEGWDTLETDRESFTRDGEEWSRYRSDDFGIRFEYRSSPDGYILVERDASEDLGNDVVANLSLFNQKEYLELLESSTPREAPPSIAVLIFNNPLNYTPEEWVEKESLISNKNLATSAISKTEFAGVPAVRYTIDGLYPSDVIVALNNNHIYYISGSYSDVDSMIRKDFLDILTHFSLY